MWSKQLQYVQILFLLVETHPVFLLFSITASDTRLATSERNMAELIYISLIL